MNYVGLDLSTHTGFVKLSPLAAIMEERELNFSLNTPEEMDTAVKEIIAGIEDTDLVVVEGFAYTAKGQAVDKQFGIGWIVRLELWRRGINFHIISPTAVKKFACNKGNADKRELAVEVKDRWNYFNKSDNITDAFIMAQIALGIDNKTKLLKFQQDVVNDVLNPKEKKPRKDKK
jgi:crossover junction endodeoxyribonuclease RuvC